MKKLSFVTILFFVITLVNAQQKLTNSFFDEVDVFVKKYVTDGKINYDAIHKNSSVLNGLIEKVATTSLSGADDNSKQAFYINAYNLLVIKGVIDNYPLESVLDVPGFFDQKKKTVAGEKLTLNQLEKTNLLKQYKDSRYHFVLVCGAIDCPPITNFAYRPEKLEQQLESQTKKALNDPNFIKVNSTNKKASISQIFEWYTNDFGGSKKSAIEFINKYRNNDIPSDFSIDFYNYNWSLNVTELKTGAAISPQTTTGDNNASRYVVSASIPKGTTETKIFNNLYTQQSGSNGERTDRSTFFTTIFSFVYGVNNRFNAGFDLRYRRVRNESLPSSALNVFSGDGGGSNRTGVTTIGPKIRWAPFNNLPNFSVQSAFWFPVGSDLEGTSNLPFIDWNNSTWWTQFFNDISIGSNFSLFTEVDFLWEDIGNKDNGAFNRVSTPVTLIFSYFPNPKTTIYALSGYSPYWQQDFDYFAQGGLGAKYQFTRNFEVELLYTAFTNEFLQSVNGTAATYNIGIRINR